ncbi:MAG: hypothetical protein V4560_15045 [Bacteroidota bacterium]
MLIFTAIFFGLIVLGGLIAIACSIVEWSYFKSGRNPYIRICKKCGSHQNQYRSNIEGQETHTWWEEVYPVGNNEKCKCHSFSEYH